MFTFWLFTAYWILPLPIVRAYCRLFVNKIQSGIGGFHAAIAAKENASTAAPVDVSGKIGGGRSETEGEGETTADGMSSSEGAHRWEERPTVEASTTFLQELTEFLLFCMKYCVKKLAGVLEVANLLCIFDDAWWLIVGFIHSLIAVTIVFTGIEIYFLYQVCHALSQYQ